MVVRPSRHRAQATISIVNITGVVSMASESRASLRRVHTEQGLSNEPTVCNYPGNGILRQASERDAGAGAWRAGLSH